MVACRSNVRAIRNGCARPFGIEIPTQKFRKVFFRVAGDNHCAVHIAKRYRLRRQRISTVYRTAVQFISNGVRFALPNCIQSMVAFGGGNNGIFRNHVPFTICFRIPTDKDITFVIYFHHGQFAIGFARDNFDIFRIVFYRSKIQIEANSNFFLFFFIAACKNQKTR